MTQNTRERLEALLEKDRPESIRFENEGDSVFGSFDGLETGHTEYGACPIAILTTEDGPRAVWLLQTVLRNEFKKARPKVGEEVAIRYDGTEKNAAGKTYHAFKVAVLREEGSAVDWDQVGAADDFYESTPTPEPDTDPIEETPF